jgi:hypothetical protein
LSRSAGTGKSSPFHGGETVRSQVPMTPAHLPATAASTALPSSRAPR